MQLGDQYVDVRRPEAGELARFKLVSMTRTRVTLERTDGLRQSLPLAKRAKFYRPHVAVEQVEQEVRDG